MLTMTINDLRNIKATDVTAVTVFSYVIGFIITNIYLSNFAFAEFTYFHIKFIPVGFVFLFLSIIIFYLLRHIDLTYKKWYSRIPLFVITLDLFAYVLSIFFPRESVELGLTNFDEVLYLMNFEIWVVTIAVIYFLITSIFKGGVPLMSSFKDIEKGYRFSIKTVFLVLFMLTNIAVYANFVYPSIPTHFGGGRQIVANIIFKDELQKKVPVRIIYQTPEYVLYENVSTSSNMTGATMVRYEKIDSIEYLGIDSDTARHMVSRKMKSVAEEIKW